MTSCFSFLTSLLPSFAFRGGQRLGSTNVRWAKACVIPALAVSSLLLMPAAFAAESAPGKPAVPEANLTYQRELYMLANAALERGEQAEYQSLLPPLADYALLPYLEYRDLLPRLPLLPQPEVEQFLARHAGSYLAGRLERQWLETLAQQHLWAEMLRFYNPRNTNVELNCQALWARLVSGDSSALSDVAPLWNVPRSQPEACDPVFAAWIEAGLLTPDLAWQRFSGALRANQLALARFIAREHLPQREKVLADTFLAVVDNPGLLRDSARFISGEAELREIVLHGLQRLAQVDAPLAMELTSVYADAHAFTEAEQLQARRYAAMRMLTQGNVNEAETLLMTNPALISDALAEWILRDGLKQQDWARIETWLTLLPDTARASERWQYWQARALHQQGDAAAVTQAHAIYQSLAQTRSFYGFLAADFLGQDYALVDRPLVVEPAELDTLADMPALIRAHELLQVGEEVNAQSEWEHAVRSLPAEQIPASGKLAQSWGWHRNGIQAMIQLSYWDDLQARFPLAYEPLVAQAAAEHDMTSHFLYAIARQESAFIQDARSSAGAMGLMQLMPATAHEAASKAGMRIATEDLLKPHINIRLGSRYLAQLLDQFGGNRIVAAAAYNAGPNRVRQWLNQEGGSRLPFDIWIETIPFGETRSYVQNVLAYTVIYGYRMGDPRPFLSEAETGTTL